MDISLGEQDFLTDLCNAAKKKRKKKEKEEDEKNVNWIIFSSFFLPLMLYSKRAPAYVKKVTLLLFHAPFTLFWQLGNAEKKRFSETSIIIYLQTYFLYSHLIAIPHI